MKHPCILLGLPVLTLLAACTKEYPHQLPPGAEIQVSILENGASYRLKPGSEPNRQFEAWLARNHAGWSQHYGAPPEKGILVHAGQQLRVQFVDSTAFARTRQGWLMKPVAHAEYSFLRSRQ